MKKIELMLIATSIVALMVIPLMVEAPQETGGKRVSLEVPIVLATYNLVITALAIGWAIFFIIARRWVARILAGLFSKKYMLYMLLMSILMSLFVIGATFGLVYFLIRFFRKYDEVEELSEGVTREEAIKRDVLNQVEEPSEGLEITLKPVSVLDAPGWLVQASIFVALGSFLLVTYLAYKLRKSMVWDSEEKVREYKEIKAEHGLDRHDLEPRWLKDEKFKPGEPRTVIIKCYRSLCRMMARLGFPPNPSYTPREYSRHISINMSSIANEINILTSLFEESRYSNHEVKIDKAKQALKELSIIRRELKDKIVENLMEKFSYGDQHGKP